MIIQKNNLSHHIIILGWSMGGSVEEAVNVAAKFYNLKVDLFIGLSAVPPLPYVMQSGSFDTNKMLPNKLADRKMLFDLFLKLLAEQNQYNHHTIIPAKLYLTQFLGNIPTAISAEGYHYQDGKFIYNIDKTIQDGGVYHFSETPWIALIRDDAPSTAKISIIDPASWDFIRAEMVYKNYLSNKDLSLLPEQTWNQLMLTVNDLPKNLTLTVHGNHFFFVGEKGAKQTANDIDLLVSRANDLKVRINDLVLY